MNVLDLFSGIGGFSLGLERAGMRTVAFCEIEPFCRAVLRKHWPGVPIYEDVRTLTGERLRADGIVPDVICGGFPCQDISVAGKGVGIEGERSGLWSEYARLIGELQPRYAIVATSQLCLLEGLKRFSETWPRSGLMRNGTAFQLQPLVRLKDATESGLLPTPRCGDGMSHPLRDPENIKGNGRGRLEDVVALHFNTPRTSPRSAREYDGVTPLGNGALNPTWVEWLMGFPLGWTDCGPSATPSSRKSRKSSGGQS